MRKIIVSILLFIVLYFAARPYVLVSVDDFGLAVQTRASESQRFARLWVVE